MCLTSFTICNNLVRNVLSSPFIKIFPLYRWGNWESVNCLVTQLVNIEPEFEPGNSDLRADTITLYSFLSKPVYFWDPSSVVHRGLNIFVSVLGSQVLPEDQKKRMARGNWLWCSDSTHLSKINDDEAFKLLIWESKYGNGSFFAQGNIIILWA